MVCRWLGWNHPASPVAKARLYAASLIFSWTALEAFVNDMMADFTALPQDLFALHERAFLEEKPVEFISSGQNAGEFRLSSRQVFRRIDEKIMFLVAKFSETTKIDKGSSWWQRFEAIRDKRNDLVHPRKGAPVEISEKDARDSLDMAKNVIRAISSAVWGKEVEL